MSKPIDKERVAAHVNEMLAELVGPVAVTRYCDACEQMVSAPCMSVDCSTPDLLSGPQESKA